MEASQFTQTPESIQSNLVPCPEEGCQGKAKMVYKPASAYGQYAYVANKSLDQTLNVTVKIITRQQTSSEKYDTKTVEPGREEFVWHTYDPHSKQSYEFCIVGCQIKSVDEL